MCVCVFLFFLEPSHFNISVLGYRMYVRKNSMYVRVTYDEISTAVVSTASSIISKLNQKQTPGKYLLCRYISPITSLIIRVLLLLLFFSHYLSLAHSLHNKFTYREIDKCGYNHPLFRQMRAEAYSTLPAGQYSPDNLSPQRATDNNTQARAIHARARARARARDSSIQKHKEAFFCVSANNKPIAHRHHREPTVRHPPPPRT